MKNLSRRELMQLGVPAVAGAVPALSGSQAAAAEAVAKPELAVGAAFPARRKQIERAWLDLLGDFPIDVPPLRVEMREEAKENGITRTTSASRPKTTIA